MLAVVLGVLVIAALLVWRLLAVVLLVFVAAWIFDPSAAVAFGTVVVCLALAASESRTVGLEARNRPRNRSRRI